MKTKIITQETETILIQKEIEIDLPEKPYWVYSGDINAYIKISPVKDEQGNIIAYDAAATNAECTRVYVKNLSDHLNNYSFKLIVAKYIIDPRPITEQDMKKIITHLFENMRDHGLNINEYYEKP